MRSSGKDSSPAPAELVYFPNMGLEVRQPAPTEADLVRVAVRALTERLPPGWTLNLEEERRAGNAVVDAVVTIVAPNRARGTLVLETKRMLERRDVPALAMQIDRYGRGSPDASAIVVARYLAPTVRQALVERGLSFVDATGNIRVQLAQPALFVGDRGADRDPWRKPGRPRGSLKGAPAAAVVRALVDIARPLNVRELVEVSGASTGATYRVVEFLIEQELVERTGRGPIVVPDWRRLVEAWSRDYAFLENRAVARFLEPRGIPGLLAKLERSDVRYAVTGSIAAATWAPYAEARNAMVYVENIAAAAEAWSLRTTETGANVLLAEPESAAVFDRTVTTDGVVAVAPSQAAVDLLTGPGRNPAEAVALMDWMVGNERAWRG